MHLRSRTIVPLAKALLGEATLLLLFSAGTPASGQVTPRMHAEKHAQGYLGIEFHDLAQTGQGVFHFRPSREVEVVMVDHDGPAGKAGLRPHDIVQSFNGQAVSGSELLRQMIHDAGAGSKITLVVSRSGGSMTLIAALDSREDVERRAWARVTVAPSVSQEDGDGEEGRAAPGGSVPPPGKGKKFLGEVLHGSSVGLQLQVMPPQLALYFGAPPNLGLLVESVDGGSVAALAGLDAGDVLVRADGSELHTLSDWNRKLHASKGRPISLTVLREHHELNLTLQWSGSRSALEWPLPFRSGA